MEKNLAQGVPSLLWPYYSSVDHKITSTTNKGHDGDICSWIHCLNNRRGVYHFYYLLKTLSFHVVRMEIIILPSAEHISWCPHVFIISFQKQVLNFHPYETPHYCTRKIAFQIHRETVSECQIRKVGMVTSTETKGL